MLRFNHMEITVPKGHLDEHRDEIRRNTMNRFNVAALWTIGAAVLMTLAEPAGAQGAIECGQVVNSSLDPSDSELDDGTWLESYDFTLNGPSMISVLMTAEGFRPYVIITDDESVTIHEGESPRVEALAAGDYKVFANNLVALAPGSYPYSFSLSCSEQEIETIGCGQEVAGQLDPTDEGFFLGTWIDPYDFAIDAPTRVRFHLDTDVFDAIIIVSDGEGEDLGSSFDRYTVDLTPGAYTVLANNFVGQPDDVYPYRLSMSCESVACPGDCDGDRKVSIAELVRGVRLALGVADEACTAFDRDGDGDVAVNELITAVRAALDGCV